MVSVWEEAEAELKPKFSNTGLKSLDAPADVWDEAESVMLQPQSAQDDVWGQAETEMQAGKMPQEPLKEPEFVPTPLLAPKGVSTIGLTHPEQQKAGEMLRQPQINKQIEGVRQRRIADISKAMEANPDFYQGMTPEAVLSREARAQKAGMMGDVEVPFVDPGFAMTGGVGAGIPALAKYGIKTLPSLISGTIAATTVDIPVGQMADELATSDFGRRYPYVPLAFNLLLGTAGTIGAQKLLNQGMYKTATAVKKNQIDSLKNDIADKLAPELGDMEAVNIAERGVNRVVDGAGGLDFVSVQDILKARNAVKGSKGDAAGKAKGLITDTPEPVNVTPEQSMDMAVREMPQTLQTMFGARKVHYGRQGMGEVAAINQAFTDVSNTQLGQMILDRMNTEKVDVMRQAEISAIQEAQSLEQSEALRQAEQEAIIRQPVVSPVEEIAPIERQVIKPEAPIQPEQPKEAQKAVAEGKTLEEFIKEQGTLVFRGGDTAIDTTRGRGRGISVSTKETAGLFTPPKGGIVDEAVLLHTAKVLKEADIPKNLQDAYIKKAEILADPNNFSSALQKTVIEKQQAIIDYARKNGFDAVEFPFEEEIRVIKPNILKTKSQLTKAFEETKAPETPIQAEMPQEIKQAYETVKKLQSLISPSKESQILRGAGLSKVRKKATKKETDAYLDAEEKIFEYEKGKAVPKAKEPWEMTQNEFDAVREKEFHAGQEGKHWSEMMLEVPEGVKGRWKWLRKDFIEDAISEGKPVPAEVLKDYPELIPKAPEQPIAAVSGREAGEAPPAVIKHEGEPVTNIETKKILEKAGSLKTKTTLSGQKTYLLTEIDKAISDAVDVDHTKLTDSAKKELGMAIIDVPGDGQFKIIKSVKALTEFKKLVNSKFPTDKSAGKAGIKKTLESKTFEDTVKDRVAQALELYPNATEAAEQVQKTEATDKTHQRLIDRVSYELVKISEATRSRAEYRKKDAERAKQEAEPQKEAKPLRMDGTVRSERAAQKPTAAFESLHPKSQEKFNTAWGAGDIAAMQGYLTLPNRGLRAEFESRAGITLPKTVSGTNKTIEDYFTQARDIEAEEASRQGDITLEAGGFQTIYENAQKITEALSQKAGLSLSPDVRKKIKEDLNTFNKYINTPSYLSEKYPVFKPIFEAAKKITQDRDTAIAKLHTHEMPYYSLPDKAIQKVDKALESGTLFETEWTDDQLRGDWKLNQSEIDAYKGIRTKYNQGLNMLADFYEELGGDKEDILKEIRSLRGYIPLSRFGEWTVTVKAPFKETEYRHFESKTEAQRYANEESKKDGYDVTLGRMAQTAKGDALQGLDMGTLGLLAKMADISPEIADSFMGQAKEFLKTRGFKKHFIERKKTPGYSEDWKRSHADYTVGLANYIARIRGIRAMKAAIKDIDPQQMPELFDYVQDYMRYMEKPGEEAAKLRSALFLYYLGANPKSAALNLTQTLTTTIPYLGQYAPFVTGKVVVAMKDLAAAIKIKDGSIFFDFDSMGETGAALKVAQDKGVVSEQMIYELMAMSRGERFASEKHQVARALAYMFSSAEILNRRIAFITAFRIGKDLESKGKLPSGIENAQAFAETAVEETQFQYGRYNRPTIARGNFGATFFTFKTFQLQYAELLSKLATAKGENIRPGAFIKALGVMFVLSGTLGLPFMDDIKKLYEKLTGDNLDVKARDYAKDILGDSQWGEYFMRGMTRVGPLDMSGAIGVGDMIPDPESISLLGPAGGVLQRIGKSKQYFEREQTLRGIETVSPEAIRNPLAAYRIAKEGHRDVRGRLIFEGEGRWMKGFNVGAKALGFTPSDLSRAYERERAQNMIGGKRAERKKTWVDRLSRALVESNQSETDKIKNEIQEYNRNKKIEDIVLIGREDIRAAVQRLMMPEDASGLKSTPRQERPEYMRMQELFK